MRAGPSLLPPQRRRPVAGDPGLFHPSDEDLSLGTPALGSRRLEMVASGLQHFRKRYKPRPLMNRGSLAQGRPASLSERFSDRLDGQEGEVVDQADLLLDEGLAIADAGQQAVVAGPGKGARGERER